MRHWAEGSARAFLERRGWRFEAANVTARGGELDLVMRDGVTLVAVEVRQRTDPRMGGPGASLTPGKLRRVRRTLLLYALRTYGDADRPLRIDAVLVTGGPRRPQMRHVPDVG